MIDEYKKKIKKLYPDHQALYEYAAELLAQYQTKKNPFLDWNSIQNIPKDQVIDLNALEARYEAIGIQNIQHLAILKLNGGLGTTMGCSGAKSAIEILPGLTFLDVISDQIKALQQASGIKVPLIFMNSTITEAETKAILSGKIDAVHFNQHLLPRLDPETLRPIRVPDNPDQEWYPPGHGEIYAALSASGLLDKLLESGIHTLFISNSDNLAATFNPKILGFFIEKGHSFLMEVTAKTKDDIKGGAVVMQEGRYVLMERAQVAPEYISDFEDITTFKWFNTNSLWVSLTEIKQKMEHKALSLPIIANLKRVEGQACMQLETALGSAISNIEKSAVLAVGRDRFQPVKTMKDLEVLSQQFKIQNLDLQTEGPQ